MGTRIIDGDHRESAYYCVAGRRPIGSGLYCNILTRRYDGHVELMLHASPETGARLTDTQAREIGQHLGSLSAECLGRAAELDGRSADIPERVIIDARSEP